jgi:beta-1,4-mannosyl-glycoprotein beta-1,4-N-acetylglucosaminyltransferase
VKANEFNGNSWYNEEHQFNSIRRGLLNLDEDDLIILGFSDEIPKASTIRKLYEENFDTESFLMLNFYYFFLDTKYTDFGAGDYWYGNLITKKKYINNNLYQMVMKRGRNQKTISEGGWHFSFLGSSEFVHDKINSYAHTEFKHLSKDNIKQNMDNLQDPLGRNGATRFIGYEGLENLPIYIQKNISKYKKYFHKKE